MDIHSGGVALRQQGVGDRGEGLGVLGDDLIGDIIFLMDLDLQTVVEHAEGSFGQLVVAGIVHVERVDMAVGGDTYERTNEGVEVVDVHAGGMEVQQPVASFIHGHGHFRIGASVLRDRAVTAHVEGCAAFVGHIIHRGADVAERQATAVDVGAGELDVYLANTGIHMLDVEDDGDGGQDVLRHVERRLRGITLVAEDIHGGYDSCQVVEVEVLVHRLVDGVERRRGDALDGHVHPGDRFAYDVAEFLTRHGVAYTGTADLQLTLVSMLDAAGLQAYHAVGHQDAGIAERESIEGVIIMESRVVDEVAHREADGVCRQVKFGGQAMERESGVLDMQFVQFRALEPLAALAKGRVFELRERQFRVLLVEP